MKMTKTGVSFHKVEHSNYCLSILKLTNSLPSIESMVKEDLVSLSHTLCVGNIMARYAQKPFKLRIFCLFLLLMNVFEMVP